MSPFQPVGTRARWRVAYDVLRRHQPGSVVTYRELAEALGLLPDMDRAVIQGAMRRAARELEQADRHAVEAVPNVGYRVVLPPEHLVLAQRHQRRSHRALKAGRSKVVNVDLAELEPQTRAAFEVVARAFALQMDFNRRMDVRQRHLEAAVAAVHQRSERSEAEIAQLRRRLEQLEARQQT